MKKQKHYSSEKSIIDKIDLARADAVQFNSTAEQCEAQGRECIKESDALFAKFTGKKGEYAENQIQEAINLKAKFLELQDHAIKCRKKARRIEEVKLPQLGNALSEFRTAPMLAIVGENVSVASAV